MKSIIEQKRSFKLNQHIRGASLLDVLLAIVIFVIGMLALAQLQTNLTRSAADSSFRTAAINFGEEVLERMRAFQLIYPDPNGVLFAFADIDSNLLAREETRANINYRVTGTVKGYDVAPDGVTLTETDPAVAGEYYDLKLVELTVSWDAGPAFQVDENRSLTPSEMRTGSVALSGAIPSIPVLATAKVNADEMMGGGPPVTYIPPGERPDFVSIQIGDQKFKESERALPEVRGDLAETWFDVVTYSQVQNEEGGETSIYLRREEFVAIQCECVLRAAPGDGSVTGFGPAVWTGAEYEVGEKISKTYGEQYSTGKSQSLYCDTCCRDHHDSNLPNKFKTDFNGVGDHPHYYSLEDKKTKTSSLQVTQPYANGPVRVENRYIEACRMVRKDGFFRVAQDAQLYEHNAFPQDYLVSAGDESEYSAYVTDIVDSELGNGGSPGSAETRLSFQGRDQSNRSPVDADGQQLRSRGIYIDSMNSKLQANLTNCFGNNGDRSLCDAPYAQSELELYPFFEIQVTQLGQWDESLQNNPVHIADDPIDDRGWARLAGSEIGGSTGISTIDKGNVGLVDKTPIALLPAPQIDEANIYLMAGGDPNPPNPLNYPVISGTVSAAAFTDDAADLILEGSNENVICSKPTNDTFSCQINPAAVGPTIIVRGYSRCDFAAGTCEDLIVCNAGGLVYLDHTLGDETTARTRFSVNPVATNPNVALLLVAGATTDACLL